MIEIHQKNQGRKELGIKATTLPMCGLEPNLNVKSNKRQLTIELVLIGEDITTYSNYMHILLIIHSKLPLQE